MQYSFKPKKSSQSFFHSTNGQTLNPGINPFNTARENQIQKANPKLAEGSNEDKTTRIFLAKSFAYRSNKPKTNESLVPWEVGLFDL